MIDPVNLVVAALVEGLLSGLQSAAEDAVTGCLGAVVGAHPALRRRGRVEHSRARK